MTPSMSVSVQNALKQAIEDYAEMLSKGFIPKDNIPMIISKYAQEVTEDLKGTYKTTLAKKYATSLVNSYVQGVMKKLNT